MPQGKIKTWISDRGFGFIAPDDGGPDVFVHMTAFEKAGMNEPEEGERVAYEVETSQRTGKPAAVNIKALP